MCSYHKKAYATAALSIGLVVIAMLSMSACDEFFPSEHALDHITVTPTSQFMKTGDTVQLSVTGVNGDGTQTDFTSSASYSSSDTTIAAPSTTTAGLITAGNNGSATITVSASGASSTVQINVFAGTLQTISVTPNSQTINLTLGGQTTQQMTATGQFSDNTQAPITNLVAWTSSNTSVATVDSSGLVKAVAAGTSTITASANVTGSTTPVTGTATITVQ